MSTLSPTAPAPRTPEPAVSRAVGFLVRATWRSSPLAACLSLLETLGRVLVALTPLFAGMLVNGAVTHSLRQVTWAAAGLVASISLHHLVVVLGVHSRMAVNERLGLEFDQRSARLSGSTATMDHLVDPEYQDRLQTLTERRGAMGAAFQSLVNTLNNVAEPLTVLVVAGLIDLRLLLLLPLAALTAAGALLTTRWDAAAEEASASPGRLSAHLMDALTTAAPASELRVLGARGRLARLADDAVRAWRAPHRSTAWRSAWLTAGLNALYLTAAGGVLWWMTTDALAGRVPVGAVAAALLVVADLGQAAESVLWVSMIAARMVRVSRRALWLEDHAAAVARRHDGTVPPPARLQHGIRLRGVTFRYPGAERPTFDGLDLDLPAGATIAVVGENGAGKSTLVNVLTGMFDTEAGEVLVDGVPLRELDLAAWRERCAGAFQDHTRFETTAREAIGIGDLSQEPTDEAVGAALGRAAATDVMRALPQGLDTRLGPDWGGVGLSGGQWQRIAIARGMMRPAPLLLVLDEPTSALDPATEHALFDGYAEAARRTRDNGGITILVTHRFSTVSAADLVVVMNDGRVEEVGTQAELLARGGTFTELYTLQAQGYR